MSELYYDAALSKWLLQASSGGGGGSTQLASFDLCLADARSSASDGDLYTDTSTRETWVFWKPATTPGWLIPPSLSGNLTIMDTASNIPAYISDQDTLSYDSTTTTFSGTLVNRGWSATLSGSNQATSGLSKTAGNPLIFLPEAAPTGWSWRQHFVSWPNDGTTPFNYTSKYFVLMKMAMVSSTNTKSYHYAGVDIAGGKRRLLGLSDTSASPGSFRFINVNSTQGTSTFPTNNTAQWVMVLFGGNVVGDDAQTARWAHSPTAPTSFDLDRYEAATTYSQFASYGATGANRTIILNGSNSVAYGSELHLYEYVIGEVT